MTRATDLIAQLAVYAPAGLQARAAAVIEEAEDAVEFARAA